FLPILRMLKGIVEYDEAKGIIVTENWQNRNRRASDYRQDTQRDRQTQSASSFSKRLAVFFFCLDFQERMVQVTITELLTSGHQYAALWLLLGWGGHAKRTDACYRAERDRPCGMARPRRIAPRRAVLATWHIRSKRACLTMITTPFEHYFCERM